MEYGECHFKDFEIFAFQTKTKKIMTGRNSLMDKGCGVDGTSKRRVIVKQTTIMH